MSDSDVPYKGISCIIYQATQTDFREIAGVKSKGEDRNVPPILREVEQEDADVPTRPRNKVKRIRF